MSREKDLARNTAILTFGKMCTQCISFFLLPLYTAILSSEEYGTFDLIVTYGTLLLPLLNWQLDQGLFRFLMSRRENLNEQRTIVSSVFFANTMQAGAFLLIMFALSFFVHVDGFWFITAYVVLHIYTGMLLQFFRGMGRNTAFAVASFISAGSTVIFNVIVLVVLKLGLRGLYASTIGAQTLTLLYMLLLIKPWRYIHISAFKRDTMKELLKYSVPLIPNSLAWWVINASDRTIISWTLGIAANGIYSVANKFPSVFINFYNVFHLSWNESVVLHFHDEDRDSFLSEMITTMFKLFSNACLLIVAVMPFAFPILINEKYGDSYYQIIILMYAMIFRVVVGLYNSVYIATRNTRKVAATAVWAAVINVAVNLILIRFIGLYAASISTLIAFASMALFRCSDIIKNVVPIKIPIGVLLPTIMVALALTATYYMNNPVLNIIMLLVVIAFSISQNWSILQSFTKLGKYGLKHLMRK